MHTILVVDDFASIRKVIADTLKKYGFETLEAGDGEEALEILRETHTKIDLVLTDYNMPYMDGFGLLKAIKGDENLQKYPVVLLTSEKANDKKLLAKEAGLNAWIEKPYKIDSFINIIKYTIEKNNKDVGI
ncbi:response regulator [Fulvivirga ligni]|uniref:response regulator n=1 Tax=Fulvivirga ligni TaxID=2904246 RepID=UPI001F43A63D|nr:response regulator [Fulvivirga ligni]UII20822.1 response regulator [Fulvivirga ligni]